MLPSEPLKFFEGTARAVITRHLSCMLSPARHLSQHAQPHMQQQQQMQAYTAAASGGGTAITAAPAAQHWLKPAVITESKWNFEVL